MILVVLPASAFYSLLVAMMLPLDRSGSCFAWCLRKWSTVWVWSAGVRLKIVGAENLRAAGPGAVILAGNHQSALDIPILAIACGGRLRFMAKKILFHIPIVGWAMYLVGFTFVDRKKPRKSQAALAAMLKRLRTHPDALAVFPEGTRTATGELQPFRRGTFRLVKQAGVPLVPFAIDGTFNVLPRGSWWVRAGEVTIRFAEPISADEVERLSRDELLERTHAFCRRHIPEVPGHEGPASDAEPPTPGETAGAQEVRRSGEGSA